MGLGGRGNNSWGRSQSKTYYNSHLNMPRHVYGKSLSTERGKQVFPCVCCKGVLEPLVFGAAL